jgi:polysaccharide deacetylase family protein (PEP-CTERM system associated)
MAVRLDARRVVVNALSIDVEDYFQVSALAPYIPRSHWEQTACRVERNVDLILQLLADGDVHATFFTLGWIAERFPRLVQRIAEAGHEVASHGYAHAWTISTARASRTSTSRNHPQDVIGAEVKGYRAPSFSISAKTEWAHDCILEAGYRYSSSVYPIRHDHYGLPDAPRFAYNSRPELLEVPITLRVSSTNWPAGGGGYSGSCLTPCRSGRSSA